MSILAVGTIGFDDIETPTGRHAGVLGGSVTYFALAASYFTDVRVVAVVGEDFTAEHEAVFHHRKVDIAGIERAPGKTFRWGGDYRTDLNHAVTTFTDLNVLADFAPKIPAAYQDSRFLFLANMPPATQIGVRKAMPEAWLTGADTMNFWINNTREELHEALKLEDVLLINDGEAKMIAGDSSLPRAAQKILAMGPRALVIKHGEYGATVFFREGAFGIGHHPFRAPALPLEEVHDPTGAGDSFAGGFMGYIASQGEINREVFKRAMFYGSVMGSFAVERFGTARLQELTREEIDSRFAIFRELTHLE